MKKVKLFCLPYAGGSAMYYYRWKNKLSDSIELVPIELSGRGRRSSEGFYDNWNELIDDLFDQVIGKLDDGEFAFFGHSMGTILVYELASKIKELKNREPVSLFVSGRYPPHTKKRKEKVHLLPDDEFINKVKEYGGMSDEVLREEQLMKLIVPILRADFKFIFNYEYIKKDFKFDCDIISLTGKYDNGGATEEFREWGKYTNGNYKIHEFEGGHFYINDKTDEIVDIINKRLVYINI